MKKYRADEIRAIVDSTRGKQTFDYLEIMPLQSICNEYANRLELLDKQEDSIRKHCDNMINPAISIKEVDPIKVQELKQEISNLRDQLSLIPRWAFEYFENMEQKLQQLKEAQSIVNDILGE